MPVRVVAVVIHIRTKFIVLLIMLVRMLILYITVGKRECVLLHLCFVGVRCMTNLVHFYTLYFRLTGHTLKKTALKNSVNNWYDGDKQCPVNQWYII